MSDDPITFHVEGEPVGKARARVLRNGGAYTPARTVVYETAIRWSARKAMRGRQQCTGACSVIVTFEMPIPTSWSGAKRGRAIAGEIAPTGKPDIDNLAKALLDALNEIVLGDDASVVNLHAHKRYSVAPKTIVTVSSAGGPLTRKAGRGKSASAAAETTPTARAVAPFAGGGQFSEQGDIQ